MAPDPLVGTTLNGRYRLDAVLGAGGMGKVYRATQLSVGRAVAVKTILDGSRDERARRRFLREATTVAQVDHPGIVKVIDSGEHDGMLYSVMELVEGETLADALKRDLFSWQDAAVILRELAEGLGAAHARGIVHRDLKPQNIMLTVGPSGDVWARILDFGIALPQDVSVRLTDTGVITGTAAYMAPEQAKLAEVDGRADLYSLGVIAWEMLTGTLPIDDPHPFSLMFQKLRTEPPSLRQHVGTDVPAPFVALVDHLLRRDPEGRPRTADEVARKFAAIAGEKVTRRRPEAPPDRPEPPPRAPSSPQRTLVLAAVVLLSFTCLAALGGWILFRDGPERRGSIALEPTREALDDPASEPEPARPPTVDKGGSLQDEPPEALAPKIPAVWEFMPAEESGCLEQPPIEMSVAEYERITPSRTTTYEWWGMVPPDAKGKLPVMLIFADALEPMARMQKDERGLSQFALDHGMYALTVKYDNIRPAWDSDQDVEAVRHALRRANHRDCLDPTRVFAIGHGQGGRMVDRLIREMVVTGAIITGYRRYELRGDFGLALRDDPGILHPLGWYVGAVVEPSPPVPTPLFHIIGEDDPRNPEGGLACDGITEVESTEMWVTSWRKLNGCGPDQSTRKLSEGGKCITFTECEAALTHCSVPGGYEWPGAPEVRVAHTLLAGSANPRRVSLLSQSKSREQMLEDCASPVGRYDLAMDRAAKWMENQPSLDRDLWEERLSHWSPNVGE